MALIILKLVQRHQIWGKKSGVQTFAEAFPLHAYDFTNLREQNLTVLLGWEESNSV